jgi:hypothetical protein
MRTDETVNRRQRARRLAGGVDDQFFVVIVVEVDLIVEIVVVLIVRICQARGLFPARAPISQDRRQMAAARDRRRTPWRPTCQMIFWPRSTNRFDLLDTRLVQSSDSILSKNE